MRNVAGRQKAGRKVKHLRIGTLSGRSREATTRHLGSDICQPFRAEAAEFRNCQAT